MIRMESVLEIRPLDNLITFTKQHERVVYGAAASANNAPPTLESQLEAYPPPRSGKWGGWSPDKRKNVRARAWYFAAIARGEIKTDGSHYLRSGKLGQGYQVTVVIRGTETFVEIRNKSDRKRHLYTKGRRQVPGHRLTGWDKDDEIVKAWLPGFRQRLIAGLNRQRSKLRGLQYA